MLKKALLGLCLVAVAAAGGLWYLANREARSQVDGLLAQAIANGAYEEASYESLAVGLNGEVTLSKLRLVDTLETEGGESLPLEVVLDEVVFSDYDYKHDIPHYMTLRASGLRFPGGLPGLAADQGLPLEQYLDSIMREDGLIPVVMDYHYTYAPEESHQLEHRMGLEVENAATMSMSSVLRGVPLEQLAGQVEAGAGQWLSWLGTAEIPRASLSLADQGIVKGLVEIHARQQNLSSEQLRERLKSQAQSLYFFVPESLQDFAMRAGNELAVFLDGGQALNVSMEPEFGGRIQQLQGVAMSAFFTQNFGAIVDLLNLRITAAPLATTPQDPI